MDDLQAIHTKTSAALRRANCFDTLVRSYQNKISLPLPETAPETISPFVMHAFLAHRHWSRTGVSYAMHPDMVTELSDLAGGRLPTGILDHLPHLNPLIVYPEPLPCTSTDGTAGELIAAYVAGNDRGMIVDTTDPNRRGLVVSIVARFRDWGPEYFVMPIDQSKQWYSADEQIDEMARKWARAAQVNPESHLHVDADMNAACLHSLIPPVLDALAYVCSVGADIQPQPRTATRNKNSRRREQRAPTIPQVPMLGGYHEGPKLAGWRRRAAEYRGTPGDGTVAPHPRRGYYAIRWTQPGRTVPRNTLIRPTYVNRHKLDGSATPTIISVD